MNSRGLVFSFDLNDSLGYLLLDVDIIKNKKNNFFFFAYNTHYIILLTS
jgi:hypothetical protein